jgi:putative ABC transport system permease protein
MSFIAQISGNSITQALQELRVNKLRTFLSLMGITIGIFCIISVLTALDSARGMIQKNVESLGTNVLYVGRWPWPGSEEGEFKWWEYWRRPSMSKTEVYAIDNQLGSVALSTLCLPLTSSIKYESIELSDIRAYGINTGFDKVQNIELAQGRYLSLTELEGGNNSVIIGDEINKSLFNGGKTSAGKFVSILGKKYLVVGVMKKTGMNMADFDFDNGVLFPYNSIVSVVDVRSLQYQPRLIIKPYNAGNSAEIKDEVTGILRRLHRIRPGQGNDFAVNQLSGFSKMLDEMFIKIDIGGLIIGGFSLLVGAFGIANIMFVTVKERTKIIGLKKAIGARRISILLEFLLESVVLCLIGGLIGILIVLLLSMAVSKAMDIEIVLSLKNFLVGIFVSVFVGVLSGFIPARSASRLDPVVAIRTH